MADDKVFNIIELFQDGLISEEKALGRLKFEKVNNQIAFRTEEAIEKCLTYKGGAEL